MNKSLVCYFSATGVTKNVAINIKNLLGADLFEIEPVNHYTEADLNWLNKQSRSSIEMQDRKSRPVIKNKINNIDDYHNIILGFPVWWYTAPTIINTFIESNNLNDKNVYIFVTSGGSSYNQSFDDLKRLYPNISFISGKRLKGNESNDDIINWIK